MPVREHGKWRTAHEQVFVWDGSNGGMNAVLEEIVQSVRQEEERAAAEKTIAAYRSCKVLLQVRKLLAWDQEPD